MNLSPVSLGTATPNGTPAGLLISTWNVWFEKHHREERNRALLAELQSHRPHLMTFQEVTPPFIRALLATEWLKDGYWISATEHNQIGVVMVGRVPVQSLRFETLTSNMGRRLLVAELEGGLTVASAHFESTRGAGESRAKQYAEAAELLQRSPAAVLTGDFNSDIQAPENAGLGELTDAWSQLHPDEPGYTVDTEANNMLNKREHSMVRVRMDRIYTRGEAKATEVKLLGRQPFAPDLFPSDHFGLLAEIRR